MLLDFDIPQEPRALKASHTVVAIAVMAVIYLGAMQVIGTEALGGDSLMRDLSEQVRVAEVSSGVSSVSIAPLVTSGIESSQVGPIESPGPLVTELAPAGQSPEAAAKVATEPEASPELTGEALAAETLAAEPPEAPCAADAGGAPYCVYVVQDGDTLWAIAETLGLAGTPAFSAAELIALSNGLNDAQNWLITPGQELRVPVASGVIHTVGESDTLGVLAGLYGIEPADIILANALVDPNSVIVGQTLLIPSPNLWPLSGPLAVAETAEEVPTEAPAAAEAEATATAEPAVAAPEPALAAAPAPNANPSVAEIRDLFAAGYIASGGPPEYIEFILARVIACESGYNLRAYNPAGPFYGLMQFLPLTWANTGGGDWFDAWQQGHNTAVLLQASSPGSQWPSCWR